ncbi:BEL1-like homeodomain protein 7 [Sesamum indicum]|uniref:BEL1-like homeodomain protein 7 n=1 Tax=Sesamum indicum TaxID=4182 RepID=A0A6I9TQZ7_SESIN|nr:BEL1-like homeodomain protein 7 [Sesamum indicum]XP_011083614.1 BEL1-like homeodomain protein 7 [Sesamum indicum]XP_011083616.1 BEL1-like homeodomain protein 7 [Sesamum indicum]
MASFYPSEGDMLPTSYMLNQKLPSYPSSEIANNKVYVSQPSATLSYANLLSGSSLSTHELVEAESVGSRDEMVFIPPNSVPTGMQQIDRQLNFTPRYSDGNTVIADTHIFSKESVNVNSSEPIPQYHGLSLSLGSQEPPLVQLHSDLSQYTSSSLCSLLSSDMQSELQLSQNNNLKSVQYLSFDLAGKTQETVKYGAINNFGNLISSKETSFIPSPHQAPEFTGTFCNSKYLKAAQDLLIELVSVHRAPKLLEKFRNMNGQDSSTGTDLKRDGFSAELQESSNNAPRDLSPSERHELQNKLTKLLSMLDEVDRRYKQYCHQMQVVVSSFDMVAGRGAAVPYTALALRTISRQFRCLRDGIKKQIQATQKSLGEQDVNSQGVLSRLRYVDQQLRQQKALQQFGVMRQPWRPQRGLPETAVSILRAWLFEHFLHPYPKDSEKIVLARQTGLTRSQVANWFINARVRLWKPMIEEMYKEEFGDAETEPRSSPEHATTAQETCAFDDREEEFQGNLFTAAANSNQPMQSNESRPDFMSSGHLAYENGPYQGNEVNFRLTHMPNEQIVSLAGNSIFSDNNASTNKTGDENVIDGNIGNQVSLALGLQHSEKDSKSTADGVEAKGNDATSSSMVLDKMDYYYVDPVNNQNRFGNSHLLSDFVA